MRVTGATIHIAKAYELKGRSEEMLVHTDARTHRHTNAYMHTPMHAHSYVYLNKHTSTIDTFPPGFSNPVEQVPAMSEGRHLTPS